MRVLVAFAAAALFALPLVPTAEAQTTDTVFIDDKKDVEALGLPGAGTASNPYILAGRSITAVDKHGIHLVNTNFHIVIRDATVVAGGLKNDGIRLVNTRNVVIEGADLQFNRAGITLINATGTVVRDSSIRASQVGLLLDSTRAAQVLRNEIAVNDIDVSLVANTSTKAIPTSKNVFRDNNLSIASGQTGFRFGSPAAYDNDIDPSNVVNFVPMRWHANVKGTPGAPAYIPSESVDVKGVTNVGQIVCYNCTHVQIDAPTASLGTAAGVLIERSDNVTILGAFAEGNEGAGVEIRNSTAVTITKSSVFENVPGVEAWNASRLTIAEVTANGNAGRGIHVTFGNDTTVRENKVDRTDGDGIVLERTNRSNAQSNLVTASKVDGLRVINGTVATLVANTVAQSGGIGIHLSDGAVAPSVSRSKVEENARGGIGLTKGTLLARVEANEVSGNGEGGILLNGAGVLNRINDNTLADQPRHIRLIRSAQSIFGSNTMSANANETGIWFDDETSYNNTIDTSNRVGGTAVQWHVAPAGTPHSPLVLRNIRVETANVTNIAQVMIYKGSYIELQDVTASEGTRGIYALRSSSFKIDGANLANNRIGIELRGAQTGDVTQTTAVGGDVAVLLDETLNVTVSDVAAPGSRVAVKFNDTRSRGSVVERVDATGTVQASVLDPSVKTSTPRHLITDAGLDKLVGVGQNVTFADALGVARFGSERIVSQRWDFGDGNGTESEKEATLRPTHVYTAPGEHLATYTVETAGGLTLSDTVRVRVVPPPDAPPEVKVLTHEKLVELEWAAPESEVPVTGYRVYRGYNATDLVLMLETVNNATTVKEKLDRSKDVFFAISAMGLGGESELSALTVLAAAKPPTPKVAEDEVPEEEPPVATPTGDAKTPPAPLGALLALAAVAALARRRRL